MQLDFMTSGDMGVVPMTLRDIANQLDIHESTVSRAIDQKNILTPHGLFALKHFFSASLGGSNGSQTSARAAQAKIRKVIESESAQQPVSDNQLVAMLNEDGITIARRTVAKYREQMKILPEAPESIKVWTPASRLELSNDMERWKKDWQAQTQSSSN